jgi:hypothetical protein
MTPFFSRLLADTWSSDAGDVCWGLNAYREIVLDLHELVGAVSESLAELADAAGVAPRDRFARTPICWRSKA